MNKKEYTLPDGSTVVFWYDEDQLGKISLEAMDMLISMTKEKWIPVSEWLPEEKQVVLISNGKGHVRCGQYQGLAFRDSNPTQWWWKNTTIETVMAWMPLPEPYNGDKD